MIRIVLELSPYAFERMYGIFFVDTAHTSLIDTAKNNNEGLGKGWTTAKECCVPASSCCYISAVEDSVIFFPVFGCGYLGHTR